MIESRKIPGMLAQVLLASALLSGCVGGTTYGTGVGQEEQTIEDLSNMLVMRKKTTAIDYKSRPDLVVPENRVLVEPVEEAANTTEADWPESPEERIARIRAEAEEAEKSGAAQLAYAKKEKTFRSAKVQGQLVDAPLGEGVPNESCDPDGKIMRKCTDEEIRAAVLAERQRLAFGTTGNQRKYLTEPPNEYMQPASTAPVGDAGYTELELKLIEAERKRKKIEEDKLRK
jgi:hypothetical protein